MLTLRNESLLDQLLAGKVNLADKTIDNCPIEVFRPESNYYRSLNEIINRYREMIKSKEEQLALIENVDVYINEHFTEEYKKREQKLLEEIEEVVGGLLAETGLLTRDLIVAPLNFIANIS